ncbi:MAG: type III pantothenate kinase [Lachnospiraceae bacterium]|nr:type III pantothenate kinase [Lachnospiraceae bacterium]
MILAIDVGNTNIVLGCIEKEEIVTLMRLHTDEDSTDAEYTVKLHQLLSFHGIDCKALEGSILSSVVPAVTEPLKRAIKSLTGSVPLVVGPGMKTGLNIRVDDPGTVAGDLIVGGVAAMNHYGIPAIIIDMGTATTVTVLDRQGSFIGGVIYPGVKLSYRALASGTSLLPDIAIVPPEKAVSANTVDCMRSGAVFGTAAMIDGLIDRFEAELGYPCNVVATGGLASSVVPYCSHEIKVDDHLLMKGLNDLFQKNRPSES